MNITIIFVLIVYMFFSSGIYKLIGLEKTSLSFIDKMNKIGFSVRLGVAKLIIIIAAILQIVAPILIVYGSLHMKKNRMIGVYSALSLAIFTVMATLLYHFPPYGANYYAVTSNITTFGSLLLIAHMFYYK
tara:strand:+ start:205 stop:597 length:393 start_codon:yes stop_codon:yes gene_type:complete